MASNANPSAVSLFSAVLVNFNKTESRDIRSLILECNIYEDLFAPSMSGDIVVADAQGLQSLFPIIGDEKIQLMLASSGRDQLVIKPEFRIYKMGNKTAVQDRTSMYSLHLGTTPFILDQTKLVDSAYGPASANEIVTGIFNKYIKPLTSLPLKTNEACTGLHQFLFPRMSPFRALALVSSEAVSAVHPNSMMLFYETHEGYHFRSLASLFTQKPAETYYYSTQNVPKTNTDMFKFNDKALNKNQIIISYMHERSFDILRGLTNGQFGMTVQYLDVVMKTYGKQTYNYTEQFKKNTRVGQTFDGNHQTISPKSSILTSPELAHSRYHITRLTTGNSRYIRTRENVANTSSPFRRRTGALGNVQASFQQLQGTSTFLVAVPGYSKLAAGHIVDLVLPEMSGSKKELLSPEKFFKGHYLITSVCHRYTNGVYTTILECMRDSYTNPLKHTTSPEYGSMIAPVDIPGARTS